MKTEALIRELAADLRPVQPLPRPGVRFLTWIVLAAAWMVSGVVVIGARPDPTLLLEAALPAALGAAAILAAFVTSVPGGSGRWSAWAPGLLLASWSLWLVLEIAASGGGHVGVGVRCVRNLALLSVAPGVLVYLMLRRAAPLERDRIGLLAAGGVAALAHAGTCFVCRNHGAFHVLVWHFAFVLLAAGAGMFVGRALFRGGTLIEND